MFSWPSFTPTAVPLCRATRTKRGPCTFAAPNKVARAQFFGANATASNTLAREIIKQRQMPENDEWVQIWQVSGHAPDTLVYVRAVDVVGFHEPESHAQETATRDAIAEGRRV